MKKLLIFLGILLMPFVAGAAYDDVTLTTGTVISVGGYSLNVSGSSAVIESLTVDTSDFSFVLLPNSQIQITSTDALDLYGVSSAGEEFRRVTTCSTSQSVASFFPVSALANTITVSLGDTCTVPAESTNTSGSSSGRSGGGGGAVVATVPTLTIPAAPVTGQTSFTRYLSSGSTGEEVTALQKVLVSERFLVMPVGVAYGYFGSLTIAAVKAYQARYGIEQAGVVGPLTRAQLNKGAATTGTTDAGVTAPGQMSPAQVSAIVSQIQTLLQQVQILQAKIKTLGN